MNIPFQVKVPVDLAVQLRDRLKAVEAAYQKELERFGRRLRAGGDPEKVLDEQRALGERGRRVTVQHLIRVFLAAGMAAHAKTSPDAMLDFMEQDTIVVGRPEAKRGPRAA